MAYHPSTVYVFTRAFNAERTIRRTIESVLNQTYPHIRYFLRDNGSTDNTYAICKEYADRDDRITLVRNERNYIYATEQELADYQAEVRLLNGQDMNEYDFLCILDADDTYLPNFFKSALRFARTEELDIVVGGTAMVREEDGGIVNNIAHSQNWVITGREFSDRFPSYHWHMRQLWGKLYRSRILYGWEDYRAQTVRKGLNVTYNPVFNYGGDTLGVLYLFENAAKVGFLSGVQHRWYIQKKSLSFTLYPTRIASDRILHKATLDFLTRKCGFISEQNRRFLLKVYFNATKDSVTLVLSARITEAQRRDAIREIFSCEYMPELFQSDDEEIKPELTQITRNLIEHLEKSRNEDVDEYSDVTALLFSLLFASELRVSGQKEWKELLLSMPELARPLLDGKYDKVMVRLRKRSKSDNSDIPLWTALELLCAEKSGMRKDKIFAQLAEIRRARPVSWETLHGDERMLQLAEDDPLLKPLSAALLLDLSQAVMRVMRGEYDKGWNAFLRANDMEISDDDAERYFQFAQDLALKAERVDGFLYFKKQYIAYLAECGETEKARKEADMFLEIAPEDEEILTLRARLSPSE